MIAEGLLAVLLVTWLFVYQLRAFQSLCLTSDLFSFEQLSQSWLHGRFLWEHHYGNALATHTYLLAPLLAFATVPLGALGLLLVSSIAAGAGFVGIVRIARLFGVPRLAALAWGVVTSWSPIALSVYQDPLLGFHLELLAPALATWLGYFLLQRRWLGSLVAAFLLLAIKEEMPLLLAAIAAAIASEEGVRGLLAGRESRRVTINLPAIACGVIAIAALPLLLWLIKSQAITPGSAGNFGRLKPINGTAVNGTAALGHYVVENLRSWLFSTRSRDAIVLFGIATLGTIFLRPACLVWGLLTTLVSWLMQDNLFWAPRLAPALGYLLVVGTLGFASAWSVLAAWAQDSKFRRHVWGASGVLAVLLAVSCLRSQLALFPEARNVYTLSPSSPYSRNEIDDADWVFSRYRSESRPEEVVTASTMLFRYAHDRNLIWSDGLTGDDAPIWILRDLERAFPQDEAARLYDPSRVKLVCLRGRFGLYRRRGPGEPVGPWTPRQLWSGPIRLHVTLPGFKGVLSEPLVGTGSPGASDLIFVTYLDDKTIQFGHDSSGGGAEYSAKVDIDYAKPHDIDLEISSLGATSIHGSTVDIAVDGSLVMMGSAPFHTTKLFEVVFGYNATNLSSALGAFHGPVMTPERLDRFEVSNHGQGQRGPLELDVRFPSSKAYGNEPLVATGAQGAGDLIFVRYLADGQVQFGVDHWSVGMELGPPITLDRSKPHSVLVDSAGLEPEPGSPLWEDVAADQQRQRASRISVWLDGVCVLSADYHAYTSSPERLAVGANALSSSVSEPLFTGRILRMERLRPAVLKGPGAIGRAPR